jgi:fluoride ion exporter CrcB/FEX
MIALVAGAAVGGVLRFWAEHFLNHKFSKHYFLGTLFANVAGSFLLGLLAGRGFELEDVWVFQFGLALAGTFTTFGGFIAQAFANLDSAKLVNHQAVSISKINWPYLLLTVGLSLAAAYIGLTAGI